MKTHCKHGHEFSKENTHINKDGSFICRKCRAIRAIHFRKSHPEKKVEKRNYMKDYQKTYYKRNQARIAESIKSWNTSNPEKRSAHSELNNAIRSGKVVRKPCEICGNTKVDGHHDDYSKPLEVIWLCRIHHKKRHEEILLTIDNK